MPTANGFPNDTDILLKLDVTAPDTPTAALLSEIAPILASVIAEFQGPVARDNKGGTGRNFTPTIGTKVFDGTGFPELRVPDVVPGSAFTVTVNGGVLTDVVLQTNYHGTGTTMLVRPQSGSSYPWGWLSGGSFPVGRQNVSVATTWGVFSTLPADIFEALRCEVCARVIEHGYIGINGIGLSISMVDYTINTASGVSAWKDSALTPRLHAVYADCVERYKDRGLWKLSKQKRRMS